jgi:very-short-patch-repair endonuclease
VANLNRHIKAVHNKIKDIECDQCDCKYSTNGELKRHIEMVHNNIKDFECDQCDYKCYTNGSLKAHVKQVHDKIKDFECDRCDYRCTTRGSLKEHVRTCTGDEKISHGEYVCREILTSMNIKHVREMRFPDCKDKSYLPFDFYLPDHMLCIEIDGRQHSEPVCFGGISRERAVEQFKDTQRRDGIKNEYCEIKGLVLLRIPHTDFWMMELIINAFLG